MKDDLITIYTDGGARGNPGPAAYGFVIKLGDRLLREEGEVIGITTNNVAEYTAILKAYSWIEANRESIGVFSGIIVRMDSLLACQQLKGIYRVKAAHLIAIFVQIRNLEKKIGVKISYEHIRRELNSHADAMVNRALDTPSI